MVPANALLLRHGVKKDSARVLLSAESIKSGVTLALCLRDVLPKALVRWLVERFLLADVTTLRLVFVPSSSLADPFWFEMPARATCKDLADHILKECWWQSLPVDTFWIHVKGQQLQLCWMGYRANYYVATRSGLFSEWTEDALTDEELQWLNGRTLLEAGFANGSNVDARYCYDFGAIMSGDSKGPVVCPLPESEESGV